ncbi:MAG: alpha-amylase family glycosyl hydrolase, partial [Oscillospiraceae bacterium]
PVVRRKIYDMINWWLDKGLAGFRIDAIINIKKDLAFPSFEPDGPDGLAACHKVPESVRGIGTFLQEMKHETFEKHDAFTVGEVFNMHEDELAEFIGDQGHFSTMFDFSAHALTFGQHGWYDAKPIEFNAWRDTIFAAQREAQDVGFLSNIIENHDEPRGASRFLPAHAQNEAGKKMLATTSLLLRGIPFIYQGQEIGMTNCRRTDISQYDDINTRDQYQVALDAGLTPAEALEVCYEQSRDNARTPMQWSDAPHAGFTTGTPWLAVNPNYREINVAEQESRADSVLNYYRRLIALRKADAYRGTFTYGAFVPAYHEIPGVLAYRRTDEQQRILVAANYGTEPQTLALESVSEVLLSNVGKEDAVLAQARAEGCITLAPCESAVILL